MALLHMMHTRNSNMSDTQRPWYHHPMMWLVIAPPLASVLAGIVTVILIITNPDQDVRPSQAIVHARHAGSNSVVPPAE